MSVSDLSAPRQTATGRFGATLALICGAGAVLFAYAFSGGKHSEGYVQLSSRQAGAGTSVRFDLPAGWRIKYNGHQPWRGGTVTDAGGRPRIEVWLFDTAPA